jgi:hypothetical protein
MMSKIIPFPKNSIKFDFKNEESEKTFCAPDIENATTSEKVVDVTHLLGEQGAQDRRKAQRVVLSHLIASHVVLPHFGLAQVAIRDIDEGGLAFEMDSFFGAFQKGDELEMRFYLNGQTYFRVGIVVAYSAMDEEFGVSRHGAKFLPDSLNQEALKHFIQFLRTVSVSLKTDRGERVVSNLTS